MSDFIAQHWIPYRLQDKIDLYDPILMGHSFGGATTLYALAKDDRFK